MMLSYLEKQIVKCLEKGINTLSVMVEVIDYSYGTICDSLGYLFRHNIVDRTKKSGQRKTIYTLKEGKKQ